MTTNEIFYKYQDKELIERIVNYENLSVMWEETVKKYSEFPAVTFEEQTHTYNELNQDVAYYRSVLINRGLKSGDVICMMADKSYDLIKAFLAAVTLNITVSVFPLYFNEKEADAFYKKFNAKLMIYSSKYEGLVNSCESVKAALSDSESGAFAASAVTDYSKDDDCIIMFTGGTSGKAKGTVLSHENVMQGIMNGCYGYNAVYNQRYILVLPLFHVLGLIRSVLTPFYTGSEVCINTVAAKVFEDIARYKPTIMVTVPLIIERGVEASKQMGKNLFGENMKYIITGAAPLQRQIPRECEKLGVILCLGYGLTETACLVTGNPDTINRPSSTGPLYPNQEIKIVDDELWLKGANIFKRYVDEEENIKAFKDGWFKTGDAVSMDEEGFVYVIGRKKEMLLKSNGENVYPTQVEAVINDIEWVKESQLYMSKDENKEDIFILEVYPMENDMSKQDMLDELAKVNESFPSFRQAQKIIIRDTDFRRTASMKMIRY